MKSLSVSSPIAHNHKIVRTMMLSNAPHSGAFEGNNEAKPDKEFGPYSIPVNW